MEDKSKLCEEYPCNDKGDCTTCSASWTGFPADPRKPSQDGKAQITELYDVISTLLIHRTTLPKAITVSEYALDRSRSRYINSLIAEMKQLNMKICFGSRNMRYEEMNTEDLERYVTEMNSIAKENEQYGSQIELQNALFNQACAEAELEDRQLRQSDHEVESFLEAQANMRDHEYELETMHEWSQQ